MDSKSFVLIFILINYSLCAQVCEPKIAIIGAGIGGASASHFLTDLFGENLEIDIFESKTIGGRLATVKFGDDEFEAGGAVIHSRNKYMSNFVKLLNLKHRPPSGSSAGIWNGEEFVFEESSYDTLTLLKLLFRYGFDPFYLHKYVGSILNDFEKIYDLQDKRIAFENVTSLIGAMNEEFTDLLQISIKDHLTNLGYGAKLIDELVEATLVVNYGQDTDVQAFVSSVSVAGAGFDLWSVKGGNKEVPRNLISNNPKVTVINATVEKINRHSIEDVPEYGVYYKENGKSDSTSKIYDIVIIAAPMTNDQETPITFNGFQESNVKFLGDYQTTFATFVEGDLNPSYFGLDNQIGAILSCNPTKTIISSIGILSSVEGKKESQTRVWKIFSRQKLDDSIISKMFKKVDEIKEIKWKAYPHYSSCLRNDKFKIDDSMYYVNAIEWAASAMEMSAIGGRNAAILAFNDYQSRCSLSQTSETSTTTKSDSLHSSEL